MKLSKLLIITLLLSTPNILLLAQETDTTEAPTSNAISPYGIPNFEMRYEKIKGTPFIFEEFKIGELILQNNRKSEIALINFDSPSKELFAKRLKKQKETNEVKEDEVLGFIIFETTENPERKFIRLVPDDFTKRRKFSSYYELMIPENDLLVKETVKAIVKAQYEGAYSSGETQDKFVHIYKYYMKEQNGKYREVRLSRKSLLSALPEETQSKLAIMAKEIGVKWKEENEVRNLFEKFFSNEK